MFEVRQTEVRERLSLGVLTNGNAGRIPDLHDYPHEGECLLARVSISGSQTVT